MKLKEKLESLRAEKTVLFVQGYNTILGKIEEVGEDYVVVRGLIGGAPSEVVETRTIPFERLEIREIPAKDREYYERLLEEKLKKKN